MSGGDDKRVGKRPAALLEAPPRIINIGLERFAQDLAAQAVPVRHVEWAPPAGGNALLADLLSKLDG
jgi:FdrA protein